MFLCDAPRPAAPQPGVPMHVGGVSVIRELGEDSIVVIVEQVPSQDLVVIAARVYLVGAGPANTAHQFTMCPVVKKCLHF